MTLIGSSNPDEVPRDRALALLAERAVLTRAVCRELHDAGAPYLTRRTRAALLILLRWVAENCAASVHVRAQADDGIDAMMHPPGTDALVAEIRAGAGVCRALSMLLTADTQHQADGDQAKLRAHLEEYRRAHPLPAETSNR